MTRTSVHPTLKSAEMTTLGVYVPGSLVHEVSVQRGVRDEVHPQRGFREAYTPLCGTPRYSDGI